MPVRFSKLSVYLSNQLYNEYCRVEDGRGISASSDREQEDRDLYLVPGIPKAYKFSFLPLKDDIDTVLEVCFHVYSLDMCDIGTCTCV